MSVDKQLKAENFPQNKNNSAVRSRYEHVVLDIPRHLSKL